VLPGKAVRPTSDRVREALFNRLAHAFGNEGFRLAGARVLDVFAGTGALGLEALSRGAAHATFIENDAAALASLRINITRCAELTRTRVLPADALKPPRAQQPCTLIFLDPPYGQGFVGQALAALAKAGWIAPGALVSCEFGREFAETPEGYSLLAERQHGLASLLFLLAP